MPEPMCLPTMIQTGGKHATHCVRQVHADVLLIAPHSFMCYCNLCLQVGKLYEHVLSICQHVNRPVVIGMSHMLSASVL